MSVTARSPGDLASLLDLPRVVELDLVDSTMDVAHALAAEGAPAGTLVLAAAQRAGRGRAGRRWQSRPGAGLWLTLLEKPNDLAAVEVLSLRCGLGTARALDRFAGARVGLKWPNDLYLHGGKLGGILVESRWRDARPDWAAIGVGVNLSPPDDVPHAAALGAAISRDEVLMELIPALRAAATARGHLGERELAAFADRDIAAGHPCVAPVPGRVAGIAADGGLLVVTAAGVQHCRKGSLRLDSDSE